jgi:hypothetical protein
VTGEEQVRMWKNPEERGEPTADHPAGAIELGPAGHARAALLGGALAVAAALGGMVDGPPISTTITWL